MKILIALVAGLSLVGMVEVASANMISNGSFEDDASTFDDAIGGSSVDGTMRLTPGFTGLTDWTITGTDVAWINSSNIWGLTASDGDYFLDLTSYSRYGTGGVAQTVVSTVIGQSYALSFDLGSSTTYHPAVDIIATASAGSTSTQFFTTASSTNQWDTFMMSFIADSTSTTIGLTGVGTAHTGYYIGLDNVSLTTIPEPVSLLLFGTVLVGLAGVRIRHGMKD